MGTGDGNWPRRDSTQNWGVAADVRVGGSLVVYGVATDGQINSNDATYSVARAGTGTVTPQRLAPAYGQLYSGRYYFLEMFQGFDIPTALRAAGYTPAHVRVTDAAMSFQVYQINGISSGSGTAPTARVRTKAWGPAAIVASDFVAGADLSALPLLAHFTTRSVTVGDRYTFTNDGLVAAIDPTAVLRTIITSDEQEAGSPVPVGDSGYVNFKSGDDATVTKRPQLVLTFNTLLR